MTVAYHPPPWNKGRLNGQHPALRLREIWALRTRLEMAGKTKELALFNLAIDSTLRGCDLAQLRVNDVARGGEVLTRASVIQQKTHEPVRFELTDPRCGCCLDRQGRPDQRQLPLPKSAT